MEKWGFIHSVAFVSLLVLVLVLPKLCRGSIQLNGIIDPPFQASQMGYIDNDGLFLLSNDSNFAFGFKPTKDVTLFLLVILHQPTSTVIWTANRGTPVANSDNFGFDTKGIVTLQAGGKPVWSPQTDGKSVASIQLENSGNLVFLASDNTIVWQSFSHPTDTLISGQDFTPGMKLSSDPNAGSGNLSYFLEINSGDLDLYAGYKTPQLYWSMSQDTRKIINKDGGEVSLARIEANSWKFYDQNKVLLWQFIFSSSNSNPGNLTWIAVLGNDGVIDFYNLGVGSSKASSSIKIPSDRCQTPEPCGAYQACSGGSCNCPTGLVSRSCKPGITSPCRATNSPPQLIYAGDGLGYFALDFVQPTSKTTLDGCMGSCARNCSCLALFFDNSSRSCYLFDRIGSFVSDSTSKYSAYVKVSSNGNGQDQVGNSNGKHVVVIIIIVILTLLIVLGILYGGYRYYLKKDKLPESLEEASEEDNFLGSLSGMPVRYSYKELQDATNNFTEKLGQGGFGSVYRGVLPDGTRIAVKQLEGIGQGKKEFRAEVSIIGSIHHVHLVRLKGFCAEGHHRLLAYEFMANGSLDKWIFKKKKNNDSILDWKTRYNIALGTAKGLAYLHEDCDVKILHCDIKPENVLLDDHFQAKVSDFGLAKLMSREQSNVFTTLRGTRGYLAPEWILNYPISEKSDVYSFGMVLLEIIGGRKNYDPNQSSEKSHFPTYAFKMMEQGKLEEILDSSVKYKPHDESVQNAIKVALWCIQEDTSIRPSMTKVAQMLEGLCPVPYPPMTSFSGARLFSSFFNKSTSDEGTASGTSSRPSECNSDTYVSAERLSGPR